MALHSALWVTLSHIWLNISMLLYTNIKTHCIIQFNPSHICYQWKQVDIRLEVTSAIFDEKKWWFIELRICFKGEGLPVSFLKENGGHQNSNEHQLNRSSVFGIWSYFRISKPNWILPLAFLSLKKLYWKKDANSTSLWWANQWSNQCKCNAFL